MIVEDYQNGNKRIAKNTIVIYGQLILRLFLGLFTSRLALEALGVSDFGLNSVVGGVVVLFTFISNSLSETTIRFINVERGKPDGDLNKVFNVCNILHIALAIFLFVLLEVGGVYYIHHYLNVDPGKEADAMFVFQVSTIMCCLGIINVPFASMYVKLMHIIQNNNSVAVCVRRGDFLNAKNAEMYNVCGLSYYERAIKLIKQRIAKPVFIFFSDDLDWVKEHLDVGNCDCFYESGKDEVWETMRLMSSCKHFIISNSTFHWWAQYLCDYPDKVVVAPSRWYGNKLESALYQDNWDLISV